MLARLKNKAGRVETDLDVRRSLHGAAEHIKKKKKHNE